LDWRQLTIEGDDVEYVFDLFHRVNMKNCNSATTTFAPSETCWPETQEHRLVVMIRSDIKVLPVDFSI
jgi:hypothetical protein